MKSNKIIYWFFKYVFLVMGLLFLGISVSLAVSLGLTSGDLQANWVQLIPLMMSGLGGIGSVVTFLILGNKLALVEIKDGLIIICKNGDRRTVNWTNIVDISQIQFVQPPLYRLRMRSSDETILFNTDARYFQAFGFTSDLSEMGRLIQGKKREFKL